MRTPTPTVRLVLTAVSLSAWLVLLFIGLDFGGAVHLFLLAGALLFPGHLLREREG